MSWITPLGFLGLLGIAALILIYLLKPNYQTKMVSSTFVWKLSLRYKKKRIPISIFRSLLLLLCQILIITACSLLLAQPVIKSELSDIPPETVAIIDASANMRSEDNGETRFQRAVSMVTDLADELAAEGGKLSVILANQSPEFLVQRYDATLLEETKSALGTAECSYGTGDIDAAIGLAEEVLLDNPLTEVRLYTGTSYIDSGIVDVVDVTVDTEWNAAILNARAYTQDNYYRFEVDLACYGRNRDVELNCYLYGVNNGATISFRQSVRCENDETTTIMLNPADYGSGVGVYSYTSAYFSIKEADSLSTDNDFYLYGGTKTPIKIQYYSSKPNSFFTSFLLVLRDSMKNYWDIELSLLTQKNAEYATEGYDYYIFEHEMPAEMPTDGVVMLFDVSSSVPSGLDVTFGSYVNDLGDDNNGVHLSAGEEHPVLQYVDVAGIQVSRYKPIRDYESSENYHALMYCGDEPVMILKDSPDEKVVIFSFDLNYSTLAMLDQFPILMYNLFNYYFPVTVHDGEGNFTYLFDVDETAQLDARAAQLTLTGPAEFSKTKVVLGELPTSLVLTIPGVYTLEQTVLSGEKVTEYLFVKLSSVESNIFREEDILTSPYVEPLTEDEDQDLMIYFAIAMVALLFLEWWLQSKDNF